VKYTLQDFKSSSILKYWRRVACGNSRISLGHDMTTETRPSVAELIRRDLGGLTQNERRAAHRLLADYPVAGLDTVARFGEAAGVSGPTVLRMIAKLGFQSYGAFQDALRAELVARRETPLMKGGDGDASTDDRLRRFAEAAIANIRQTEANVAREEFNARVRLLSDRNRPVHVLGGRFTDAIADYLVVHLRVLRPQVRRIVGERLGRLDQLLDVGKRDVFVLFDIRRYSDDLIYLARQASKRGATVTLFTDQWLSPISKVAKHVLPAHVVAPSVWDSAAGLLLLVEAVLSAVASELGNLARDRLTAIEALRED
jgi:DNA-binding MurR/RpiR family transcriptional regulator